MNAYLINGGSSTLDKRLTIVRERGKYSIKLPKKIPFKYSQHLVKNIPKKTDFDTMLKYIHTNEFILMRLFYYANWMDLLNWATFDVRLCGRLYSEGVIIDLLKQVAHDAFWELQRRTLVRQIYIDDFHLHPELLRDSSTSTEFDGLDDESLPGPNDDINIHNLWVQELREAQQTMDGE